jgi:hypothetical protein
VLDLVFPASDYDLFGMGRYSVDMGVGPRLSIRFGIPKMFGWRTATLPILREPLELRVDGGNLQIWTSTNLSFACSVFP